MIRSILLLASVGMLSQPALAQLRDPSEVVTRNVSTTEGQPLLVRTYAMWRSDCTPRGEPVVTITAQPQHGTVTMRPGLSTLREYTGGAGNCVGHQVAGVAVWYQPAPGYRGPDQFGLMINTGHVLRDLMLVNVQ